MSPVVLILGLLALLFLGILVVKRIPKGGGRRKKTKGGQQTGQSVSAPEMEPGDWFSASSFNAIPQLEFLVRAAREGGPDSISMVGVFDRMVEGAARTQALESANSLAAQLFEGGASAPQVVTAIEAAAGSAKRQQQMARRTSVRRGTDSNPYGVEE